jgi:hypothetical protein
MNKFLDIGLIGLAGSGKDTVADIICASMPYNRLSFALALKKTCEELGWDGKKDLRGRKLLQDVGMAFREYSVDTWVNKTAASLKEDMPYVFTDVRFINEAQYIKNYRKGIIIRIVRPSLKLEIAHQHISEYGQDDVTADFTIINDGTIEELKIKTLNTLNYV